jgi:serine/threonine protein kinase
VYEVVQRSTRRHRALKVMLPGAVKSPELRERFAREATIGAGIESEHVVQTLDAGVDDASGMPFIVMELLRGEDLRGILERRGKLPPRDVLALAHQIATALDKTHAAGVIHRDLKPANLFVTHRDDGTPCVKILDFGVAKVLDDVGPNEGTKSVGSPLYMAPEQIRGDADIGPRADLYALAHLTFTMLVGHAYWTPERRAALGVYPFLLMVMKGAQEAPTGRAATVDVTLPKAFDAWFMKATALSPKERFADARTQCGALAEVFALPAPSSLDELSLTLARPVNLLAPTASDEAPTTVLGAHADATHIDPEPPTHAETQHSITAPAAMPERRASSRRAGLAVGLAVVVLGAAGLVVTLGPSSAPSAGAGEGLSHEGQTPTLPAPSASPSVSVPLASATPSASAAPSASAPEPVTPPRTGPLPAASAARPTGTASPLPSNKPPPPGPAKPDPLREY